MIRIGPAGSGGLGNIDGVKKVKELGLNAMEVEFTYGVKMQNKTAKEVGRLARQLDVKLSVHAPYYINLASGEKAKVSASIKRILDSCEKAYYLSAHYVVFHAGFYQTRTKEQTFKTVGEKIQELVKAVKNNKWPVAIAPETTGKNSQFGSLDELLRLREETGCSLCVDFAHILAREGRIDYDEVFDKLKPLKHIHSHFSGIEYTPKGERRHILTAREKLIPLVRQIKKRKLDITIINESPNPVKDSILTKKIVSELGK